jgi:hypothetical protein
MEHADAMPISDRGENQLHGQQAVTTGLSHSRCRSGYFLGT